MPRPRKYKSAAERRAAYASRKKEIRAKMIDEEIEESRKAKKEFANQLKNKRALRRRERTFANFTEERLKNVKEREADYLFKYREDRREKIAKAARQLGHVVGNNPKYRAAETLINNSIAEIEDLRDEIARIKYSVKRTINEVIRNAIKFRLEQNRTETGSKVKSTTVFVLRAYYDTPAPEVNFMCGIRKEFSCAVCSKMFSTTIGLIIHQKEHEKNGSKKCFMCPEVFETFNLFAAHFFLIHSHEFIAVETENEVIYPDEELERSLHEIDFRLSQNKCPICSELFLNLKMFSQHIIDLHGDNEELLKNFTFVCSECNIPQMTRQLLETHWKTACKEIWEKRKNNNIGMKVVCKYCGLSLSSGKGLSTHMALFHGDYPNKNFYCQLCGSKHFSEISLNNHRRIVHGKKYPHSCEKCGNRFKTEDFLTNHLNSYHSGETLYECTTCHKRFASRFSLKSHVLNSHTECKSHKCNFCDKSFASGSDLIAHESEHEGFKCKMCGANFNNYFELSSHREVHRHNHAKLNDRYEPIQNSEKMTPSCGECGETFKSYLALHFHNKAVHEGLKYVCEICGRKYKTSNALKNHNCPNDDGKHFGCSLCGKKFRFKTSFYNHKSLVHKRQKAYIVNVAEIQNLSRRGDDSPVSTAISHSSEKTTIRSESKYSKLRAVPNRSEGANYQSQYCEADNSPKHKKIDSKSIAFSNPSIPSGGSLTSHKSITGAFKPVVSKGTDSFKAPSRFSTLRCKELRTKLVGNGNTLENETTYESGEHQHNVLVENYDEEYFLLTKWNAKNILKLKTEGQDSLYDDDLGVDFHQFNVDEVSSNGENERKGARIEPETSDEDLSSSDFQRNALPRLFVKLSRLLEYKCAPCHKTIFVINQREITEHLRTHRTNLPKRYTKSKPIVSG